MNARWILLLIVTLSACTDEPPPPRTIVVKAADHGDKWPLVASEATLGCEPPTKAYVDIAGRRCGLNGKALKAGFERCDDAAKSGNAASFGLLLEKALPLCPTRK